MIQPEEQEEKKKGILDRLPKMGRISQLVLIIGVFLALFIPIFMVNQQQAPKQAQLSATLTNLRKIVSVEQAPKTNFEAELAQLTAEAEANKAAFPSSNQAPEILDSLLELAELNDISVTKTSVSTSSPAGAIGPTLTITLGLKGQVPKFQNFLLALDDTLPTSQIRQAAFTVATTKEAQDTASVTIDIFCYEGSN